MNGEQVKPRSFKERWAQVMAQFMSKFKDAKPANVQDYNEQVMLGLFGEKLIDLLNEEAEKIRKLIEGNGTILAELMDHAEVLKDDLEKLRADVAEDAPSEDTVTEERASTEVVKPE